MKKLADISRGLCEALEFIHAKKLTHSDLKTDNVLFGSDEMVFDDSLDIRIKLIDFGAATWEQDKHAEVIQTRHYRAPEVVMGALRQVFGFTVFIPDFSLSVPQTWGGATPPTCGVSAASSLNCS